MTPIYNLHYFESKNKDVLNIILNGFNDTNNGDFILGLFNHCRSHDQSVISFDYEFQYLNQDKSSGPELEVEVTALNSIINQYAGEYQKINFIAKSLGGIVVSKYLNTHTLDKDFSVKILGYIHDDIEMGSYISKVSIVQGENDKFGSGEINQKKINEKYNTSVPLLSIAGGDHSYRNADKTGVVGIDEIKTFILL